MRCHAIRSWRVDQPHSATFITSTRRPSAREARLEPLRVGLLRPSSAPSVTLSPRIAIAPHALGLLVRPRAVAQAVAR